WGPAGEVEVQAGYEPAPEQHGQEEAQIGEQHGNGERRAWGGTGPTGLGPRRGEVLFRVSATVEAWPGDDGLPDDFAHLLAFGAGEGKARLAHRFGAEPRHCLSELAVLDQLDRYVAMQDRRKPTVDRHSLIP